VGSLACVCVSFLLLFFSSSEAYSLCLSVLDYVVFLLGFWNPSEEAVSGMFLLKHFP
jgi:hypothetical protein